MISIKRFLLIGLLSTLLISFTVIFLLDHYQTTVEVNELYDTQLAQTSRILQGFLERPTDEIDFDNLNTALSNAAENYLKDSAHNDSEMRNNEGHRYEHKFAIQVWDDEKNLLVKSPAAPLYAIAPFSDGYSTKKMGDFNWNIFTHKLAKNSYWIVVAERADVRDEMVEELTYSSLAGPMFAMIFLALGTVIVVAIGLKPLITLSQQIRERHIDKLEPLEHTHVPKELIPLAQAVNTLMTRVSQDIERERQFLGDIAHELRTPLAAMKLNAQNGLQLTEPTTRHFFIKIVQGVDRSIRLIEQLLTLARLDPRALGAPERCNFGELTQDIVGSVTHHLKHSGHANIKLHPSLFEAEVYGYPILLSVLLRNLIENAIRHSPDNGEIFLTTASQNDEHICLEISDQGPGVQEPYLSNLGKRFFRERSADRSGNGLGLSIVTRIAELHQAHVTFHNVQPHGLMVSITFPHTSS